MGAIDARALGTAVRASDGAAGEANASVLGRRSSRDDARAIDAYDDDDDDGRRARVHVGVVVLVLPNARRE